MAKAWMMACDACGRKAKSDSKELYVAWVEDAETKQIGRFVVSCPGIRAPCFRQLGVFHSALDEAYLRDGPVAWYTSSPEALIRLLRDYPFIGGSKPMERLLDLLEQVIAKR